LEGSEGKVEQVLVRLMEYQEKLGVDHDGVLIMLTLVNLMGLVSTLNRGEAGEAAGSRMGGGMEALMGPLLAMLAAAGMSRGGSGAAAPFNPAVLLSLLGGGRGKGGQPDLSALMGLLGALMGAGGQQQCQDRGTGQAAGTAGSRPVQREINLDKKGGAAPGGREAAVTRETRGTGNRPLKAGEVLKWKFGT